MSDKRRESFDVFAIPKNFGEDGMTFNGISRRNMVEGVMLAVASGYPIVMYLPFSMSVRIILICFISLPLFFFGLVGLGGESLSQFVFTFFKWLFRRRELRYYIDTGEPEPERAKGIARVKSIFHKRNKEAVRYKKVRKRKKKNGGGLFDRLFLAKKADAEQDAANTTPKSREIKNMAQSFLPVQDIRGGMIVTKDNRYIKIVEIQPINFLLRSADEQRDIILSFAELLRIAPVKIQFKSNANRADISKFLARTKEEMERETNAACREMDEDYIDHIQSIATNNAISRRFFVIFEYTNPLPAYSPTEGEIRFALESVVRTFRSFLWGLGAAATNEAAVRRVKGLPFAYLAMPVQCASLP